MRTTRIASAIAGSALLAISLVGCSEAEKAADDAKGKASDAAESGKAKAGEKGKKAAEDAKKKLGDKAGKGEKAGKGGAGEKAGKDGDKTGSKTGAGAGGAGKNGVTVDYGDFEGDPSAQAAAGFFEARQAAIASDGSDTADLKAATTPKHFKQADGYVKKNAGKATPVMVKVVGVEGSTVDLCAGAKGTMPRSITVKDGKVAANAKGQHTC